MRERELRLALVCYGGISLAVWMHGITREVWHLARAGRTGATPEGPVERVYADLLAALEGAGLRLTVLVDILAGASAGGLNSIFLGHAIATGRSLDPLTSLWLDKADIEALMDPAARPGSRLAKMWATPLAWAAAAREAGLAADLDAEAREQVRAKLGGFVRSRWFEPPFGGAGFSGLLLDAFDRIDAGTAGPPLLPPGHPLDLFVTVTDFHGYPERLRLHSPAEVVETEHRLTLAFRDRGAGARRLADPIDLVFAARATASFPGAFPPFTVAELDALLAARGRPWPGRAAFLARALPRHCAAGLVEQAVLLDGSVLANAPFAPAIAALRNRPARREIVRRFLCVDPHPGTHLVQLRGGGGAAAGPPSYLATLLGALSDIPRQQPIRDALEALERRSAAIARMRRLTERLAPYVEQASEAALGPMLLVDRLTPARLGAWRRRAARRAARHAGYAHAAYAALNLAAILDEIATLFAALGGAAPAALRTALDAATQGLDAAGIHGFFEAQDLRGRIRRLRGVARRLDRLEEAGDLAPAEAQPAREALLAALAPFLALAGDDGYDPALAALAADAPAAPMAALAALAAARALPAQDAEADRLLAAALAPLPRAPRRALLLAYCGFPFHDAATLPLLQGDGLDENDPVAVDRLAPEDAVAIPGFGPDPLLKGLRFHGFGAFFSRVWREHDYLWGRLHGAERLIDIAVSALPAGAALPAERVAGLKRRAFRAILAEERPRLGASGALIDRIAAAIG
ncbi:patatin-like protein [Sphingomonas morindae]|uniref:Patatin-like protein n=1 Tax=Sphingomonas morindae TaxID=1541170 RepID=A0ABY4X5L0_9SPHN|nr:patatin-like protein [Sphingomonas morindae]USI72188.1 patatin-like protein [Sphingomonas morindae]